MSSSLLSAFCLLNASHSHMPLLIRNQFFDNLAIRGGAMQVQNVSRLEVSDAIFRGNQAFEKGGGAAITKSTVDFKNSAFLWNIADDGLSTTDKLGGAMYVTGSTKILSVTLDGCNFTQNHATYGGALYLGADASIRMDTGNFVGNSAVKMGGAVRLGALSGSETSVGRANIEFSGDSHSILPCLQVPCIC